MTSEGLGGRLPVWLSEVIGLSAFMVFSTVEMFGVVVSREAWGVTLVLITGPEVAGKFPRLFGGGKSG